MSGSIVHSPRSHDEMLYVVHTGKSTVFVFYIPVIEVSLRDLLYNFLDLTSFAYTDTRWLIVFLSSVSHVCQGKV